ncbi:class I adenylate-forming enzyme family protein [Thermogemmatispora tikiterensis]|uniref:AMP-dependent synthetase n=1 Tax=Thermogemmatispora tikiterensis TaxID=1825093 RepID=A0A328V9B5_9CHLR|nr:class I adenylate-forming enzyme family protein [Thermogemmatispora tikiterensis]RAQ94138.1 hypothetical protein A4R35_01245 [Thermogemmatispora tikiterensis]
MKEHYPARATVPQDWLVPPELQPDFLWEQDEQTRSERNVGREAIDLWCNRGHGERPAVIWMTTGEVVTFQELKEKSDHLAGALIELGVEVGDRLALRYSSQPAAIIAAVAAWKAGAAVVPIPAQARCSEIEFYLNDSAARWAIVLNEGDLYSELAAALPQTAVRRVVIGRKAPHQDGESLETLMNEGRADLAARVRTQADDLATVWHTGGTTGRPKATYHTHRRWLAAGRRLARTWGIQPGQVWLYGIPISNVAGLLGRFICTLQPGATLVEPENFSGVSVLQAIVAQQVTHLLAIPVTLSQLAQEVAGDRHALASVQQVYAPFLTTGAGDLYARWQELGHYLGNPLGSSIMCQWFIGPRADAILPPFALGKPVEGYEIRIVPIEGTSAEPLPAGEVGRVAARGPTGLTYWNRPELQRAEVNAGWTITDDLGRMDENGIFWFMGRLNNLVVTAGYKVVPGEVEEVLQQHPQVQEVAVVGLPDPLREQVVAAFVVLKDSKGDEALAQQLQQWCKERLAPYKYPRKIFFRDHLPRDPVGKVQIQTLIQQAADQPV